MDLTFSSLFTTTFYSSVLFLCIFFEKSKQNAPSWCSYINSVHSFDSFKINVSI